MNSTTVAEYFRSLGIGVALFNPKDFIQAIVEQQRRKPVVILLSETNTNPEFDQAQITIFSFPAFIFHPFYYSFQAFSSIYFPLALKMSS